jgi:hypothetical protein
VYHLELRQFPHNVCRFNLSEQQLREIVDPWTRDPWVEVGERRWRPETAKLTVLEGPQIPLDQLSMGRGWRVVQRNGKDVTERVLAAAKQAAAAAAQAAPPHAPLQQATTQQAPPRQTPPDAALIADSLGLELLALLGDQPAPLSQAWALAAARFPERSPSESLAIAEGAVASLLRGGLIVLFEPGPGEPHAQGHAPAPSAQAGEGGDVERLLAVPDSWLDHGDAAGLLMRRL